MKSEDGEEALTCREQTRKRLQYARSRRQPGTGETSQGQERHRVSDGDRLMDGLWSAARFSFCTTKLHAIFQPSIKSAMPTALLGDSWEIRKELEREVLGLQTDGKVTEKSGAAEQNNRGRATTGNSREALLRGLPSHTI